MDFFVWLIFWLVCLFVGGQIFLCMCVLFGVFFGVFLVWFFCWLVCFGFFFSFGGFF